MLCDAHNMQMFKSFNFSSSLKIILFLQIWRICKIDIILLLLFIVIVIIYVYIFQVFCCSEFRLIPLKNKLDMYAVMVSLG